MTIIGQEKKWWNTGDVPDAGGTLSYAKIKAKGVFILYYGCQLHYVVNDLFGGGLHS